MRVARAIVVLAVALGPAGCGTSDHDQVQAKVEQFASATARKDYGALCRQVLAPVLVRHLTANGISCEQAMAVALGGVRNPSLSIGKIILRGQRASVITLTMAEGQEAALDSIELVKTGAGWRIASLGSPLTAAGSAR